MNWQNSNYLEAFCRFMCLITKSVCFRESYVADFFSNDMVYYILYGILLSLSDLCNDEVSS